MFKELERIGKNWKGVKAIAHLRNSSSAIVQ